MASLNSYVQFLNVAIINWDSMEKCKQIGYIICFDKILVCAQMIILFYFYFLNLSLFMIFDTFPKKEDIEEYDDTLEDTIQEKKSRPISFYLSHIGYFGLLLLLFSLSITSIVLMWVFGTTHNVPFTFSYAMGLIATILVFVQWTPQIIRTYRDKSAGNFSIVMVAIMTPSSFGTMIYLMLLSDQHFTTWISYLCSGAQQLVLLILCIFYEFKDRFWKKKTDSEKETEKLLE